MLTLAWPACSLTTLTKQRELKRMAFSQQVLKGEKLMTFYLLDCDEQSHFYGATETGALVFYQDLVRDGRGIWAFGGAAQTIGSGWNGVQKIICGDQGVIYDIDGAGRLLFF